MCPRSAPNRSPARYAPAIALAFAAALLATAIPARGSVILVPDDYPTIQAAISAAVTGDEVRVAAGTYTGNANKNLDLLGKDIAVLGEGPGQTIIDCQSSGRGFYVHSGETEAARIEGFEIRDAWGYRGGGIRVAGAHPHISNCTIFNCNASWQGGGIYIAADGPTSIEDCLIRANIAHDNGDDGGHGGGIFVDGPVTIRRCTIGGNTSFRGAFQGGSGGGVCVESGARLEDCLVHGNSSWGMDGGGGVDAEACVLVRCQVLGNTSATIGGGVLAWSGDVTMEDCLVAGNLAYDQGGGVAAAGSGHLAISGTTVASNYAGGGDYRRGGGLAALWGGTIVMSRSILWANCALAAPEGYISTGSSLSCACCDLDYQGLSIIGDFTADGCMVLDPRFCDAWACDQAPSVLGEYTVEDGSPCLPDHSPCGALVGALGQGCAGPTPVETLSWGRIKNRFR